MAKSTVVRSRVELSAKDGEVCRSGFGMLRIGGHCLGMERDGQEWRGHVDEWLQEKGIEWSGENACGLFIRQKR